MDMMMILVIGAPTVIFVFVLLNFYRVFIRKRISTPFYTPFDEITGQSQVEFHVEQEILVVDEDSGDGRGQ